MAERKIFAGARLKRLRQRLDASQSQMAAAIGVSPSYLNLIERNQRPLTVQVLLKLSRAYGIDVAELSGNDGGETVEALREVFADPLLVGEIASPAELADFADAAPNAARGMTRLFEAYREALVRLSDLSQSMVHQGTAPADAAARSPFQRVQVYFEEHGPAFAPLEEAADEIAAGLKPRDDPAEALRAHLKQRLRTGVRILPAHVMPVEQLRYDRHTLTLFLSERVPLVERPFLMARQIALLAHRSLLDRLTEAAGMADPEAARLCRAGFARRLGEAVLAPAGRLAAAARDTGCDVMRLSQRFVLRPSRIMARLAALGAAGTEGIPPAFMLTLDASGTVIARIPGAGFPFPKLAPLCARLPLFDGLTPGRPVVADLVLPDGSVFAVTALAEESPADADLPPPRRLSLIGWRQTIEGRGASARPVGVTCRLCERSECAHRSNPMLAQPAALGDHVVGPALEEPA
jgi:predicted transcriptional regulator/transcriptional regulator with XRE-family HTH domain